MHTGSSANAHRCVSMVKTGRGAAAIVVLLFLGSRSERRAACTRPRDKFTIEIPSPIWVEWRWLRFPNSPLIQMPCNHRLRHGHKSANSFDGLRFEHAIALPGRATSSCAPPLGWSGRHGVHSAKQASGRVQTQCQIERWTVSTGLGHGAASPGWSSRSRRRTYFSALALPGTTVPSKDRT